MDLQNNILALKLTSKIICNEFHHFFIIDIMPHYAVTPWEIGPSTYTISTLLHTEVVFFII